MLFFLHSAGNDQIHDIYWRAEQKYRKFSKVISIAFLVYDQSPYVSTLIYSFYYICIGNTDLSTWPVAYELSVPFDTTTMLGWYLQLLITMCNELVYLTYLLLATSQFIGCCMYIAAMCEHFDLIIQTARATIDRNRHEKKPRQFRETNGQIKKQISEAIQIHVRTNE